jgi:Bacterial Ig-like domain (group 3)/Immunoglobulin I-set domain
VQWQVSTDGGVTFNNVPGATSTTLSFSATAGQNNNRYRAVFTNSQGSATTTAATLTVSAALAAPVITQNPSNQTVNAGNTATFTAAASGNPVPTVQWQVSTDGGATFNNVPGATSTTLSFTAALGQNGNKYRAVFTNSQGSATTTAATLTVSKAATSTTLQSSVNPSAVNQSVTFTAHVTSTAGTPTGTVTFTDASNGNAILAANVALVGGAASVTTSALTQGSHTIVATYSGDANFATSNGSVVQVVGSSSCTVTAKLRGPFYNNGTYTAEPSIDAQISQTLGGLHRELFASPLGSVTVQNAQTTACANVGTNTTSVTFSGTASGGSGAYTLGDIVTTTLAYSSPTTINEVTDIWNAAHTIHKAHSVGSYNVGPNSYLTTS